MVLAQAAAFLRDLPAAWHAATAEQRNALARTAFQEVEITDHRVTAVLPVPEFSPFINLQAVDIETGRAKTAAPDPDVPRSGSDGESVARMRYGVGYVVLAEAPPVERVERSRRAKLAEPRSAIDEPTRERIRALAADGWSLRRIIEDVGVSHESVRKVLVAATLSVEA